MRYLTVAALALLGSPATGAEHAGPREAKTVAAVLAADDDWLAAEKKGDVVALDRRLSDGYRDVDPDGTVHPKSELLGWTADRKERAVGTTAEIASEFRRRNPTVMRVAIFGDTAILSFHSTDPSRKDLVMSVDVFSYENGMWRGVLSKHSSMPVASGS